MRTCKCGKKSCIGLQFLNARMTRCLLCGKHRYIMLANQNIDSIGIDIDFDDIANEINMTIDGRTVTLRGLDPSDLEPNWKRRNWMKPVVVKRTFQKTLANA